MSYAEADDRGSALKFRKSDIRVILFYVGGVLVELSAVSSMLGLLGDEVSEQHLWRLWLTSPAVRTFETGRSTPEEFAERLITEMSLPIDKAGFLKEFERWPVGLFPGTLDLIGRVPRRYTRATLGNSNTLHWPRIMDDMRLKDAFDRHFASHLIGKLKPDEEVFRHVTENLGCTPEEVLFLDDNIVNIEAANKFGMMAFQVRGATEAEHLLTKAGVLRT